MASTGSGVRTNLPNNVGGQRKIPAGVGDQNSAHASSRREVSEHLENEEVVGGA
jgi:hypothetical protein